MVAFPRRNPGTLASLVPQNPQTLIIAGLKECVRRIDELATAQSGNAMTVDRKPGISLKNGANFTVFDGGSILINDGGAFYLVSADGTVSVAAGTDTLIDGSGRTQQSFYLFRSDDGSVALALSDLGTIPGHTFAQALQHFDRSGNIIFAEDANGNGLALPYLSIPFKQVSLSSTGGIGTTTSGTFFPMEWAFTSRLCPRFSAGVLLYSSAADTTGEARITQSTDGAQLGSTMTIAASAFGSTTIGPLAWPSWTYKDRPTLQLEVRRTAGTGNVGAAVFGAQQEQA